MLAAVDLNRQCLTAEQKRSKLLARRRRKRAAFRQPFESMCIELPGTTRTIIISTPAKVEIAPSTTPRSASEANSTMRFDFAVVQRLLPNSAPNSLPASPACDMTRTSTEDRTPRIMSMPLRSATELEINCNSVEDSHDSRRQSASNLLYDHDLNRKRLWWPILCILLLLLLIGTVLYTTHFYEARQNLSRNPLSGANDLNGNHQQIAELTILEAQLQKLTILLRKLNHHEMSPQFPAYELRRRFKTSESSVDAGVENDLHRLLADEPETEYSVYQQSAPTAEQLTETKDDEATLDEVARLLAQHELSSEGFYAFTDNDASPSYVSSTTSPLLAPMKAAWLRKLYKSHVSDEKTVSGSVPDPLAVETVPRNMLKQYNAIDTAELLSEIYAADAAVAAVIADGKEGRLSGRIVLLPDLLSYISATNKEESAPYLTNVHRLLGKVASPILVDHSAPDALEMHKPPIQQTIELNATASNGDGSTAAVGPGDSHDAVETIRNDNTSSTEHSTTTAVADEKQTPQQQPYGGWTSTTAPPSGNTTKVPVRNSDGRMAFGPTNANSTFPNRTLSQAYLTSSAPVPAGDVIVAGGITTTTTPPPTNVCYPVATPICNYRLVNNRLDRYEQTTLTPVEQRQVFSALDTDLRPLIKLNQAPCHFIDDLLPLYCALYVPKCGRNSSVALPPCRSFCTRLLHNCEWYMYALNLAPRLYSDLGDCSRFPDSDDPNVCLRYIPMAESVCPADHHRCDGGRRCIPAEWVCDRFIDCRDRSDEANCAGCPNDDDFVCPDKTCVSNAKVCDGVPDCMGGRDEVNCVTLSKGLHSNGEGKLEVYDSDTRSWRGVCANNWTTTLSNLTCASLGYKHTINTLYSQLPAVDGKQEVTPVSVALFEISQPAPFLVGQTSNSSMLNSSTDSTALQHLPTFPLAAVVAPSSHRPVFLQWMHKSSTCTRQVELSCSTFRCGIAGDRSPVPQFRIIGGEKSEPGKWPFLVSIYVGRAKMFFCGGTIISDRWILTAAHCVFDKAGPAAQLNVRVGDHRRSAYSKFKMEHQVVEVIRHPAFASISNGQYVNDIALLKLAQPISFTDYARPVCLPPPSAVDVLPVDTPCTVIGWGIQTERSGQYSNVVNEVVVRIVGRRECRGWYTQRAPNATVGDDAICAGYREGKRDACRGDSGGPLLYFNETMRAWTQAGIVSWGSECARAELPGVYAKVSAFTDWIYRIMDAHTVPAMNE